jgi:hypothetical protein
LHLSLHAVHDLRSLTISDGDAPVHQIITPGLWPWASAAVSGAGTSP